MRLRALAFGLLVAISSTSLPAVEAFAQAPAKEDPFTEMARQRFQEGVKLYDQKRYEESRAAFLQAYALKKHPAVLLNLAQSELKSNHAVEAARHFSQFLRENQDTKPGEKKSAEQGLAEARTKTGRLQIDVNVPGAEVFVDGELVGRSPLGDVVDVAPGQRKVEVKLAGYPNTTSQINATTGQITGVNVKLDKSGGAAVVAPVPGTPPPASSPATPATPPVSDPASPPPTTTEPTDHATPSATGSKREPFFKWVVRDKVAWATGGVTVIGTGMAVIFAVAASNASSNADSIAQQIKDKAASDPQLTNYGGYNRTGNPCAAPIPSTSLTSYSKACGQLKDNLDARDTDKTLTWVGVGVAAVGVGATVGAYFMRAKPIGANAENDKPTRTTVVTPIIAPGLSGLSVGGTF